MEPDKGTDNADKGTDNGNKGTDSGDKSTDNGNKGVRAGTITSSTWSPTHGRSASSGSTRWEGRSTPEVPFEYPLDYPYTRRPIESARSWSTRQGRNKSYASFKPEQKGLTVKAEVGSTRKGVNGLNPKGFA